MTFGDVFAVIFLGAFVLLVVFVFVRDRLMARYYEALLEDMDQSMDYIKDVGERREQLPIVKRRLLDEDSRRAKQKG